MTTYATKKHRILGKSKWFLLISSSWYPHYNGMALVFLPWSLFSCHVFATPEIWKLLFLRQSNISGWEMARIKYFGLGNSACLTRKGSTSECHYLLSSRARDHFSIEGVIKCKKNREKSKITLWILLSLTKSSPLCGLGASSLKTEVWCSTLL